MPTATAATLIRLARPEDAIRYGAVCSESYRKINESHGFPPDFTGPEETTQKLEQMFSDPAYYCVVAEADGRVTGNVGLDERAVVASVGPVTVDPDAQNQGIGRQMLDAVLERARERGFAGVRLVQATFNNCSLALYASLGFEVREPLALLQGPTELRSLDGYTVRAAQAADLEACNALCRRVHGLDRSRELAESIAQGVARIVERGAQFAGYASSLAMFGHAVAETNLELKALIASAAPFQGPGILVPTRNSELFRWCLAQGLRVVQPMTLMSIGLYNEPRGAWLPSAVF